MGGFCHIVKFQLLRVNVADISYLERKELTKGYVVLSNP